MKKKRMFFLRGVAILAAALVLALCAAFVIVRDRAFSPTENRNLQTRPALTLSGALSGRYERRFDDYVADQFPFRDGWIALNAALERLSGKTESGGVFLGGDGYLIQGFAAPSEADYRANLDALKGFLGRHGELAQYVLIAPTAVQVLSDKLPALAQAGDEAGYMDRLLADLADAPAQLVDVRSAFAEAKAQTQLYYRTDHHWTTDGAYLAYRCLAAAAGLSGDAGGLERRLLSADFRGTLSALSGFRVNERDALVGYLPAGDAPQIVVTWVGENAKSASLYRAECLDTRDQYAVFLNGNHPEIKIETAVQNQRALLVLKDSYANCLIPFLARDYRKIVVVDPRYYTGELEVLMEAEGVSEVLFLYNAETFAADTALRADLNHITL